MSHSPRLGAGWEGTHGGDGCACLWFYTCLGGVQKGISGLTIPFWYHCVCGRSVECPLLVVASWLHRVRFLCKRTRNRFPCFFGKAVVHSKGTLWCWVLPPLTAWHFKLCFPDLEMDGCSEFSFGLGLSVVKEKLETKGCILG